MRYLALLPVLLLLVACGKKNPIPEVVVPPFSCDNSADDGRFELWNAAEQHYLFEDNPNMVNPDTLVRGYIIRMDSVDRTLSLTDPKFHFRGVYDTGKLWAMNFALVDRMQGRVERRGFIDRTRLHMPDTVSETVDFFPGRVMAPGCKRLYYFGYRQTYFSASTQLTSRISGIVVFKGHYDVELK